MCRLRKDEEDRELVEKDLICFSGEGGITYAYWLHVPADHLRNIRGK